MFDIFEQPWTLIGASVIVLFIVFTIRSVFPEKRKPWQLGIPLAVATLGFGLDMLVQTDMEKVNELMGNVLNAVRDENCDALAELVADDYSDSYHANKARLIARCRSRLSEPLITKIKITGDLIEVATPTASATIFGVAHFEPSSYVARDYRDFVLFKVQFYFDKQADKNWLVSRIEIREIDKQPFYWGSWR